jgi:hypothetical protein
MATSRQKLLQLLHGEDPGEIIVCPLIDSWAFEDTSEMVVVPEDDEFTRAHHSRGPVEDQLHMGEMCGYEPIALQDIDWSLANPNLVWQEELVSKDVDAGKRIDLLTLRTPYGDIVHRRQSSLASSMRVEESSLTLDQRHAIIGWYADQIMNCDLGLINVQIQSYVDVRGERGLLSSGVAEPFTLFGLLGPGYELPFYHYADHPEEHERLAELVAEVARFQADVILDGGYDLIWTGSTGHSGFSARYYRRTQLKRARSIIAYIQRRGGVTYSHDCNPVAAIVRDGVLSDLGSSLFETLSPPPAGDIDDLAVYRRMIDPSVCTKGNIDVGDLLTMSIEQVRQATREVIEATRGYRHMVGTGDDVYFGTPIESIRAMVDVAKNHTGRWQPAVAVGGN